MTLLMQTKRTRTLLPSNDVTRKHILSINIDDNGETPKTASPPDVHRSCCWPDRQRLGVEACESQTHKTSIQCRGLGFPVIWLRIYYCQSQQWKCLMGTCVPPLSTHPRSTWKSALKPMIRQRMTTDGPALVCPLGTSRCTLVIGVDVK